MSVSGVGQVAGVRGIIESLERLPDSRSGVPRYRVHMVDGSSYVTEPDRGVNPYLPDETMIGKPVILVVSTSGKVLGVAPDRVPPRSPSPRPPGRW